MKRIMRVLLSLLIAVMVIAQPCSAMAAPARSYLSTPDFTKVRWSAEWEGVRETLNGGANTTRRLRVDALPGSEWTVGAEFIRVRDSQLVPFRGESDVSLCCEWISDELSWTGEGVRLPEAEGVYTLTGRFIDDEHNLYVCDIVFNVSSDSRPAESERLFSATSDGATTVEEKVAEIAAECESKGFTTQYEKAVWLHDWLINNAEYDYTYTNSEADGVLLKGTGVCDSYSKAYNLLLGACGFQHYDRVTSDEMMHAWNIVEIDGTWCHVDCTWDDPGKGSENHQYFGMSDELIGRDHSWEGSYPAAGSLDNYYPLREGELCFSNTQELSDILSAQMEAKADKFSVVYIGLDPELSAIDAVSAWLSDNASQYGVVSCETDNAGYSVTLLPTYSDPWYEPENHLDPPVDAPDFDLGSPSGNYQLSQYGDNGIVLVFGNADDGNTRALLNALSGTLDQLYSSGVDVLVGLQNASSPADLEGIEGDFPGFHYFYGVDDLWDYLLAVGYSGDNVSLPGVFVISSEAKITYYHKGYMADYTDLIQEALAVGTGNPLPEPAKAEFNGTGNINGIQDAEALVQAARAATANGSALLVMGNSPDSPEDAFLGFYEEHYSMFNNLDITLIASFETLEDAYRTSHPHCVFVDFSDNDFFSLIQAVGHSGNLYYRTSMLVERGGVISTYTNGKLLNINECVLHIAQQKQYAAVVPDDLLEIEAEAFMGATFESIDLTNGMLETIGNRAFKNCSSLCVVRIPASVTHIESDAFEGCGNLTVICENGSEGYSFALAQGLEYICE